jgi:hypothetical protein
LEPIESFADGKDDGVLKEGYDEMLYRQSLDFNRSGRLGRRDMNRRGHILSEIGEIPEEESSIDASAKNGQSLQSIVQNKESKSVNKDPSVRN